MALSHAESEGCSTAALARQPTPGHVLPSLVPHTLLACLFRLAWRHGRRFRLLVSRPAPLANSTTWPSPSPVYDRQIRLWGVEAQSRMQKSTVLLLGLSGIHTEACKNLVLAGVNVTVNDDQLVRPQDLGCQFFVKEIDIGENVATRPRALFIRT